MISSEDIEAFRDLPKHTPIIVGFCGAKGHGKDTAAQALIDKFGFQKVSFADGLRKTVCTALRCNEQYFLDPDKKEEIDPRTGKARRYWLQWIGTEGFRALWGDIWIEWWRQEIISKGYERVVTTDVRFPNEVEALRRFPRSTLLRVSNPFKPVNNDAHASELHYRDFSVDEDIENDWTIELLRSKTLKHVAERFTEVIDARIYPPRLDILGVPYGG
jgi:hypothetical protein